MKQHVLIEIDEKFLKALPEEFYGKDEVSTGLVNEILIAVMHGTPYETVTEFADRCRKCEAKYGKLLKQESNRNMEEIAEVIKSDADAETKCKMISNILTAKPHYFEENAVTIKDIKDGGYFKRDDDIFIKPPYQDINHKDGGYYLGVNISTGQTLNFPHYTKVTPASVKIESEDVCG